MTLPTGARLLVMMASPLIWAVHFLIVYPTGAVLCVTARDGADAAWTAAITTYAATGGALAAIAAISAYTLTHLHPRGQPAVDGEDAARSQTTFLSTTTLMLSALSAIAVVFSLLPAIFSASCQ